MLDLRSHSLHAIAVTSLFCAALLGPLKMPAQSAAPTVRIVSPIDEGQLVTLKGNTHPQAIAKYDEGAVRPDLPMSDLTLVLSRGPERQAAFDAFVASQYDAGSPNFHQWLTPAQIGEQFGPAQADVATISGWLAGHGFNVTGVSHDRMTIHFSGTAAQAESAFHVEIHNLSVNGAAHIANMNDPQIPAALAPVVLGVKGMHNFLPKPMHKLGSKVQLNQEAGKWQRVPAAASTGTVNKAAPALATGGGLRPQFGIGVPGDPAENELAYLEEDIAPADFATIYNVQPLYNNSITGTGQTIAIIGTSDLCLGQSGTPCNSVNDVATFRSAFGLSAGLAPAEVKGANGIDPGVCSTTSTTAPCTQGDLLENSLDVEWSGAVAPGAQIVLVTSGYNSTTLANITNDPLYQSAQYVIDNHGDSSYPTVSGATIVSMSYGECELFSGTSSNVAYNNLWQTATAEGISVFVSTGDSGSASCDDGQDGNYGNPYSAQFGLTVSGQASTPYNTAVGGTDFSWCKPMYANGQSINGCPSVAGTGSNQTPYWNTSNTSSGESAKGYVPEIPWNDTCTNPIWAAFLESLAPLVSLSAGTTPEEACNFVENDYYTVESDTDDGVDISSFLDTVGGSGGASNCVANNSDTYTGSGYPSCTSGAMSTGPTTNPTTGSPQASLTLYNDGWPKPSWQNTSIPGVPNDGVRDLPDVSFFAGDGSLNSATLVCSSIVAGAPCAATASGNGSTTMIEVGGTSVATPEMAAVMALINQKIGTPQGLATPGLYKLAAQQTYSNCSSESVTNSTSCYFNDVDQGTNAMACDLGAYEGGDEGEPYAGVISPNCADINSQDAKNVGTLVSSGTTPGYNAILGYDQATGLGSLNVANVVNAWRSDAGTGTATLHVTLNPSNGNVPANSALTFTISVTGSGLTPTGSVTVSGGGYGSTQSLTAGAATIAIPPNSLAPGSQTLTVTYSGDSNYASTSTPETINVAADSPTVTVTAPTNQNIANSFPVSVSVSGPVGAPVPTGTLTLASGAYSSTAVTLNTSGVATFTIPAHTLAVATDTLTATYSGSGTYAGGTGNAVVTISGSALLTPTVTVTPASTHLDSGEPLEVTVKVTGSGATPTGTVTLTSPTLTTAISGTLDVTGTSPPLIIPANSLASGTDTLTFTYYGDANYNSGTGTSAGITVTQSTYVLAAGTPSSSSITPGSSAAVAITGVTPTSSTNTYYSGTVTFNSNACNLTSSSVTTPNSPPTCSISGTITYSGGVPSGSATATVSTTAAVASLAYPTLPDGRRMLGAGGGAILAFLVFLGIPARRSAWRAMLGLVMLIAALGSLSACGGGSVSGNTGNAVSATSAGTYTFTATGSATPSVGASVTTAFTVTVN